MLAPTTAIEAAAIVAEASRTGRTLRPRGGGTKLDWGTPTTGAQDLDARGLAGIIEHNAGDFTAVVGAGTSFAAAQEAFAATGQMLALDPPLGRDDAATIGGVLATNDSGPLRHRYGSSRDLVLGVTVVLSDGTIAKSGGTVIKNVAGYDLSKLFIGSFGTLGLMTQVAVRLHPLPATTATVAGVSRNPDALAATIATLARLPLEAECLDVHWHGGAGQVLVRFAGAAAEERAMTAAQRITGLESVSVVTDDAAIWRRQRDGQRLAAPSPGHAILKVAARPAALAQLLRTAEAVGATVVSRAVLGLSWLALPVDAIGMVRTHLAPAHCTVLDGGAAGGVTWPVLDPVTLTLMRRVKERFDPSGTFRPGSFAGGI